ncbi:hypothetical protein [Geminisphaera colitermitum]|uniref:hypothetical protein n=1 Tax=Geminisphaera colitermitum TaxID=1148786 RepID=UPI000158CCAB|nr:hypothetical protein [Geminisphaera colitermitum]
MQNKRDERTQQVIDTNVFIELLAQLGRGTVAADLAEKYPQAVQAVRTTGKKAELTFSLIIKPDGKGEVQSVEIETAVKLKLPERDRKPTVFFIERDSNFLTRNDPKQMQMFPESERTAA